MRCAIKLKQEPYQLQY